MPAQKTRPTGAYMALPHTFQVPGAAKPLSAGERWGSKAGEHTPGQLVSRCCAQAAAARRDTPPCLASGEQQRSSVPQTTPCSCGLRWLTCAADPLLLRPVHVVEVDALRSDWEHQGRAGEWLGGHWQGGRPATARLCSRGLPVAVPMHGACQSSHVLYRCCAVLMPCMHTPGSGCGRRSSSGPSA